MSEPAAPPSRKAAIKIVATVLGTQKFLVSSGKIAAPFDVDAWVVGR